MLPQYQSNKDRTQELQNWMSHLEGELQGYWRRDVWFKKDCPLDWNTIWDIKPITYSCKSIAINTELKFGVYQNVLSGRWQKQHSWKRIRAAIYELCRWLNKTHSNSLTLTEKSLLEWEISCRSFLITNGLYTRGKTRRINASLEIVEVDRESDIRLSTLRKIYEEVILAYDSFLGVDPFDKDIWDLEKLKACDIDVAKNKSLNFGLIHQDWFKYALKKYFKPLI